MTEEELRNQFLRELDIFYDDWLDVFKKNNIPIGQVGGLLHGYSRGDIEEIPGPMTSPRFCPICKQRPVDMEGFQMEEMYQDNGQEFLSASSFCDCDSLWGITYKLLSVKMEELKEGR